MKQYQIPGTDTITTRLKAEIAERGRSKLSRFYQREGLGHIARNRRANGR